MKIKNTLDHKDIYKNYLIIYSLVVFIITFLCLDRFTSVINFFWSDDFSFTQALSSFMEMTRNSQSIKALIETPEYQESVQAIIAPALFFAVAQYMLIFVGFYSFFRIIQIIVEKTQINGNSFYCIDGPSKLSKKTALASLLFLLGPIFALPAIFAIIYKHTINNFKLNEQSLVSRQSMVHFWFIFVAFIFFPFQFALQIVNDNMEIKLIAISAALMIGMFPLFIAFSLRWLLTIEYKNFIIFPAFKYFDAIGFFFKYFLITVATLGIYFPIMLSKTYEYLADHTKLINQDKIIKLSSDFNHKDGLIVYWKYLLLSIITLGLALPVLITKRVDYITKSLSIEI